MSKFDEVLTEVKNESPDNTKVPVPLLLIDKLLPLITADIIASLSTRPLSILKEGLVPNAKLPVTIEEKLLLFKTLKKLPVLVRVPDPVFIVSAVRFIAAEVLIVSE
jgi:hypothetical protein